MHGDAVAALGLARAGVCEGVFGCDFCGEGEGEEEGEGEGEEAHGWYWFVLRGAVGGGDGGESVAMSGWFRWFNWGWREERASSSQLENTCCLRKLGFSSYET